MISRRLASRLAVSAPHISAPLTSSARYLRCRHQSTSSHQPPTPWRPDTPNEPDTLFDETYARHTIFTFDVFQRLAKYSLVALVLVGATTWTAFEGAHMYVEHVALAPEADPETRKWGWDRERERWSGGTRGGTDPALGFKGAHAVRSAWIAQHWGTGDEGGAVIGSRAFSGRAPGAGALNVVEARLEFAQDFLSIALGIVAQRTAAGKGMHPETAGVLLSRHASILERMGSRDALFEARTEFERVWKTVEGQGDQLEKARIALKLGDLNHRLGDGEDALGWWAKAIQLCEGKTEISHSTAAPIVIPESAPSSPLAQRTLASALVSMSAYYATSGQLRQAHTVEDSALNLLRSIRQPVSLAAASPPQALHALYLLHRSALLSIHLAEVQYALRSSPEASISWLQNAAESSERVALALTGLPLIHPDAPNSRIPHPPASEKPLLPAYTKSSSLSNPASGLLRDARRSAAEAWNLIGVLTEGSGKGDEEKALECYERALGWAGVAADRVGNIGEAGEGVLEAEWRVLWANYVKAREAVKKTRK